MAAIVIDNMSIDAHIGATESERINPQRILVSLRFEIKEPENWGNISLDQTVDYFAAAQSAAALLHSQKWELVEHAASALGQRLLLDFPAALSVLVEIRKLVVPNAAWTGVQLSVGREPR